MNKVCPKCGDQGLVRNRYSLWHCQRCNEPLSLDDSHTFEAHRIRKIIDRDTITPLRQDLQHAKARIAEVQAKNAELRAMLVKHQWAPRDDFDTPFCAECCSTGGPNGEHDVNCAYVKLIGAPTATDALEVPG